MPNITFSDTFAKGKLSMNIELPIVGVILNTPTGACEKVDVTYLYINIRVSPLLCNMTVLVYTCITHRDNVNDIISLSAYLSNKGT